MLKIKRMAILAVVALGLVALAAPAGASAKTSKRVNEDIKRLGNNVSELRKKTDEMNNTIASLANVAGSSLVQLRDGLTALKDTTADFKYGVVQVATRDGATSGIGGVGPTHFFYTPPIYKTGAQSTVTFPLPVLGKISLYAAVRSLDPNSGKVGCRVLVQSNPNTSYATLKQGTTDGAFINMPQSDIKPKNGNTSFPVSLVPTEDLVLNLADPQYIAQQLEPTIGSNGGVGVLSCLRTE